MEGNRSFSTAPSAAVKSREGDIAAFGVGDGWVGGAVSQSLQVVRVTDV